jgi:hypothetical protein
MKNLFRLTTFVLLVGGWALAAASVQVVRTTARQVPYVLTKEHLTYHDTYLDTRTWTIADDKAHPDLVEHVIRLNRPEILASTVEFPTKDVKAQLIAAVEAPSSVVATVTSVHSVIDPVQAGRNAALAPLKP